MHTPTPAQLYAELPAIRAALRTPWPTLLTLAAALWAGAHSGFYPAHTAILALLGAQLALLAVVDARTLTLPHTLTGLLALTGMVFAPILPHVGILSSTLGGLVAFVGAVGCMVLADKLAGKPSLGGGDVWLITAIGCWLGAGGLPMFLLATAGAGVATLLANRLTRRAERFPFGPALAAGGWLAMLYQSAYWHTIQTLTA